MRGKGARFGLYLAISCCSGSWRISQTILLPRLACDVLGGAGREANA